MTFNKDFKEAISHLPSAEKDKLILRLLKKDYPLANRLYFELLDGRTMEDRRAEMEEKVKKEIARATQRFFSTGYLHVDMRYLSGEITNHVRITKDKYGEASLNLLMLNEALRLNSGRILEETPAKAYKICLYIIARTFKILIIIQKLPEDYFIEFQDDLMLLGQQIEQNGYLMQTVIQNGFDVYWLLQPEIPENIAKIHKDIRAQGFLQ